MGDSERRGGSRRDGGREASENGTARVDEGRPDGGGRGGDDPEPEAGEMEGRRGWRQTMQTRWGGRARGDEVCKCWRDDLD